MIEALDHAQARGAEPIAEVIGYGTTSDALHMTAGREDGDGAKRAMQMALQQAGGSQCWHKRRHEAHHLGTSCKTRS